MAAPAPHSTHAVSAPGKVLFAGGFLVLDRAHTGLVFGLNARIHVHVRAWADVPAVLGAAAPAHVLVSSPQFRDASWLYGVSSAAAAVTVRQVVDDGEHDAWGRWTRGANKFVETALRFALVYLARRGVAVQRSMRVTVLADDDYYSRPGGAGPAAGAGVGGFTDFGVTLGQAHKTGLGSSAALVTALVGAVLGFHGVEGPGAAVHNLAQAAHCAAQGKVGSGFDVAAAVYGSCLYRRFSPEVLDGVGELGGHGHEFAERLHRCVEDLGERRWDVEVQRAVVRIPEGLVLVMCDVDCGSETPGMVRKVLQWRKDNTQEAALLWEALQRGQEELCRELKRLSEEEGIKHDGGGGGYGSLADILATIRSLVREMSAKSDVPIEPPVITELLDACTAVDGVVGGVAPGAGGYDAVALLLRNDPAVVNALAARLEGWKSEDETGAKIGRVRLLGVKQDKEGMRVEQPTRYSGWI